MSISRRKFIGMTALAGAGLMVPWKFGARTSYAVANSDKLTKWIQPMRGLGPTGIPVMNGVPDPIFPGTTMYQVTAGEFVDQLHPQLPNPTKLWGYWDSTNPVPRHLGGVIVANRGNASRIRFTNNLPTQNIIPVDTTVPGANQAQNRIAIHLHGGYVPWISDGGPFDWWTPTGVSGLSFLNGPGSILDNITGLPMAAGQADYFYPNDQSTRLMWYHDHAHGITRTNAYAGLATGYLVLDPAQEAALVGKVPSLASTLPLVWQDKVFVGSTTLITDPTWSMVAPASQALGSLWYDHVYDPKLFKLKKGGAFLPPPDPSCIPEFFGDTMLCNGTVYPKLTVEPKPYRLLMLNACNARFLNINTFVANPANPDGIDLNLRTLFPVNPPGPAMVQIGTEGGYLLTETTHVSPKPFNPATLTGNLMLGNAERADVIVDFSAFAGQDIIFYNDAPGPFPAGPPSNDYFLGNPNNPIQPLPGTGPDTRQILRISVGTVVTLTEPKPVSPILNPLATMDPAPIVQYTTTVAPIPPLLAPAGPNVVLRNLTLNEDFDIYGRLRQMLGTTTPAIGKGGAAAFGLDYLAPATEVVPAPGTTEVWNVFNLTADTHPIHFHIVNVQVLSRQPFRIINGVFTPTGVARGPEPNEVGWKETVQMHPGEVTRVVMRFDLPAVPFPVPPSPRTGGNEFVWHCHILEHEEHDMMRPLIVLGANPLSPMAVEPVSVTITGALGGTASFKIGGGLQPYSIVSSDAVNYPAVPVLDLKGAVVGFTVAVPALAAAAVVTYTVTDNSTPATTKIVTLNIV